MAKQRNIRIDIIKAVGIICVVLGHTEVMPSAGFVNLFHVGLFFIASGIFYKESYTDTAAGVGTVIVKRIKRLYIPFVLYNLFFLCFRNALTAAGFLDGMILDRNGILRQVFGIVKLTSGEVLPGPDWFIRALFILEVLYTLVDFLIKKICRKHYHIGRWVVSAGLLGLGYFLCVNKVMLATNYFTIPLDLGTICSSWILFTAGFELPAVLKKFKAKWNTVKDILLMLACFVILCVMMRFGGISYADNYYPNIPYFLIAAASGFGFSYGLAGLLEKTPSLIKRFFVFTGGVTLEILMMHLLGFKIVTFIIYKALNLGRAALASFPVYSADYWIAYLITGMAFSLVFAFVWGKIKGSLKTRLGVKRFIVYLIMAVIFAVVPNMLLDRIHAYNAAHPDYSLVFDKDYYLENYSDLQEVYGEDAGYDELLGHFISSGMDEGRIASEDFDPHFYRDKYKDLDAVFGDDWRKYYEHYMLNGAIERRQGAPEKLNVDLSAALADENTVEISIEVNGETPKECELVALDAYMSDPAEGSVVAEVDLNETAGLTLGREDLNSRYVLVSRTGEDLKQVSNYAWITGAGEFSEAADNTFEPATKKGLQIGEEMIGDVIESGTSNAFTNLIVNRIMTADAEEDAVSFTYKDREYYFRNEELEKLDRYFSTLTDAGITVTCGVINLYDESLSELYYPAALDEHEATFYALNTASKEGLEYTEAFLEFMSERYDGSDENCGLISRWCVGNEVNESRTYNFCGEHSLADYITEYSRTFRVFYNIIKENIPNAQIYVPLMPWWGIGCDDYTYGGKQFITAFAKRMKEEGDIDWGLAYHAYSFPLSDPKVLNDGERVIDENGELTIEDYYTTDSEDSVTITMENLEVLTEFMHKDEMRDPQGNVRSIILSEQGYTSNSNVYGHCEALQAASMLYAYYKAESLEDIDAFIYFLQKDDQNASLGNSYYQFGLSYDKDGELVHKLSYDVFKIMDTRDSLEKLACFKDVLGIENWSDVIAGFNEEMFGGLPETEEDPFEGRTDIAAAEFSVIAPQTLEDTDGYECLPEVTVTLDGKELVNDADYDLVYLNNTETGTGRIIAVGLGEYTGYAVTDFVIE